MPPDVLGFTFAADVLRRCQQYILVIRETVSSYTIAMLIDSERRTHLQEAILTMCAELCSFGHTDIAIRVDSAPGFVSLVNDPILRRQGIQLQIGSPKNINKNPIAERAIEELEAELLRLNSEGGPVSTVSLALATAQLNSRIRHGGLSARELWTHRDQCTGDQLPVDDRDIILAQHQNRLDNHFPSAKSKAHGKLPNTVSTTIKVGDLVYLKGDRDKNRGRDKYLVVNVVDENCIIRKFTKSQFRSKTYTVRIADCYPVLPTYPTVPPRGPDWSHPLSSESDSDLDVASGALEDPNSSEPTKDNDNGHIHIDIPLQDPDPPLPDAIVQPLRPPSSSSYQDGVPLNEQGKAPDDHSSDTLLRRSRRAKKAPVWLGGDNWILE
jgi:hypothetical protein